MADAEKSPDLPLGWAYANLGSLATGRAIAYGVLKPGERVKDGVPMLRVKDLVDGRVDISDVYRISSRLAGEYKRTTLSGGEVLLSIQGTVGRVALVPPELAGGNVSRTLAVIPPNSPELGVWLHVALRCPPVISSMLAMIGGTTRDSLNLRDLRVLPVPVPPLAEQRRIVAKLEELLTRVDTVRERLDRVPRLVRRIRAAVLAAACSGRLTADWRETLSSDDAELPKGWRITTVGDDFEVETGTTPSKKNPQNYSAIPTTCPFFKPTDLDAGFRVATAREWLSPTGERLARVLPAGTVCVTSIGTIGKTGLLRTRGATNQQINSILPSDHADPSFIYYICCSPSFQSQLIESSSSTTISIINKGRFKTLPLVLPPLAEQREIVRRVDALMALADAVEAKLALARRKVDRITQAVLAKAFAGELVPTEHDLAAAEGRTYETAEQLLAQICPTIHRRSGSNIRKGVKTAGNGTDKSGG